MIYEANDFETKQHHYTQCWHIMDQTVWTPTLAYIYRTPSILASLEEIMSKDNVC